MKIITFEHNDFKGLLNTVFVFLFYYAFCVN